MALTSLHVSLACCSIASIAGCLMIADAASSQMIRAVASGDAAAALHFSDLRSRFAVMAILAMGVSAGALLTLLYVGLLRMVGGQFGRAFNRADVAQ